MHELKGFIFYFFQNTLIWRRIRDAQFYFFLKDDGKKERDRCISHYLV